MSIHNENRNGIEIIYPINDLDSITGEEVKQYVSQSVTKAKGIIVNFTKVNYLNSSGLRELIQTLKIVQDNNKKMALSNLSENIHKIFVNTNLYRLFDIFEKVDDAEKFVK
jgi:anti-sigma B factor antagonist